MYTMPNETSPPVRCICLPHRIIKTLRGPTLYTPILPSEKKRQALIKEIDDCLPQNSIAVGPPNASDDPDCDYAAAAAHADCAADVHRKVQHLRTTAEDGLVSWAWVVDGTPR